MSQVVARFLTRVELHGAKHGDDSYKILHQEMAQRGFVLVIPTSGGNRKLPTAEYFCAKEATVEQVFNAAKAAANATDKTSEIITVKLADSDALFTDCPPV